MVEGILLVDKPKNWTSHDVVAKVRNTLKQQTGEKVKVGHTGTLDPMASGLLILVIGSYTKRAGEFSKLDKTYEVKMKLGENSSTGDAEGEKVFVSEKIPEDVLIKNMIKYFTGRQKQVPPAYSAIKVGGRKAYDLARRGKEVKLEPREINIYGITEVNYDYPFVSFVTEVSSGTYIRSLVGDIGRKLGTGAYLAELNRTTVGDFSLKSAVDPTGVNIDKLIKT